MQQQHKLAFTFFLSALAACGGRGGEDCDSLHCGEGGSGGFGGEGGGTGGTAGSGAHGGAGGTGGNNGCFDATDCRANQFCEFNNACGPIAFLVSPGVRSQAIGSVPHDIPAPSNLGFCVDRPKVCPAEFAPVCGCDNKTYGSDCERRSFGVAKAFDGACDDQTITVGPGGGCGAFQGRTNRVCGNGLFCEADANVCPMPGGQGTCQVVPQQCVAISSPVCGCDGRTYQNDCARRGAKQSLSHKGTCGPVTGGIGEPCGPALGIACNKGLVCDPEANQCSNEKFVGFCRAPTEGFCPKNFAPVCGCDGRTYANDCTRLSAGVTKSHEGECKSAIRFLEAGVWGGQHAELIAKDPHTGGFLKFDCGRAEIVSPLEVDGNGNFMWKARYELQGGFAVATSPSQPPFARDAIITGAVNGGQMKFSIQIAGSMANPSFGLTFGTPGIFKVCL